jgi:hypothetical protein
MHNKREEWDEHSIGGLQQVSLGGESHGLIGGRGRMQGRFEGNIKESREEF